MMMSPEALFDFSPMAYGEVGSSRAAALKRLAQFQSDSGHYYRAHRNEDLGPSQRRNVSVLSAAIRRRLLSETEVLTSVLSHHSPQAADKFIQEVFWRSYFKGWLQHRPQIWDDYLSELSQMVSSSEFSGGQLGEQYQRVIAGRSGIDCMDAWVRELPETGYLHNHARMWFASIWIFTLGLPWQLGARFFYQHLLDGDPASNTLSWRWVGGLHTVGKHYLAKPGNISRYTHGRFDPGHRLVTDAEALPADLKPDPSPIEVLLPPPAEPCLLVVTEEDCCAEQWDMVAKPAYVVGLDPVRGDAAQERSDAVLTVAASAVRDGVERAAAHFGVDSAPALVTAGQLPGLASQVNVRHLVTAYACIGPTRDTLDLIEGEIEAAGLSIARVQRPFDQMVWPYACAGFFGLKKKIPMLLKQLALV